LRVISELQPATGQRSAAFPLILERKGAERFFTSCVSL